MIELGYKAMQLWLSPTLRRDIERAALEDKRPMTQIVIDAIRQGLVKRRNERRP